MAGWGNKGVGFRAEMQDFMGLQRHIGTACSCIPAPCAGLNFALPGGQVQGDMFADWINQYRPALRLIQDR
ncbi:MAG TPA: hypothetical protein DCQ77_07935 [Betaproteobacteria bacterium]|nr:hypothetical protein [Betaproteobacteria bacterium]